MKKKFSNTNIYVLMLVSLFAGYCSPHKNTAKTSAIYPGKAGISFRIAVSLWTSENRFNELLDLFDRYKGVTDEITLFTSETHAPLPPDVFNRRMSVIGERIEQAHARGYKCGINILTTIGHHEENLDNSLKGDYTYMTNIDGAVCRGSFCPNDPQMREYIREIYRYAVQANPDYIWIDDDIRFGHMPIGYGCFCDHCLDIFKKESGTQYSRVSLKKAFNEGTEKQKLEIRNKWLSHNRTTISGLLSLIERTVHEANPSMPLGFMSGERYYEGYDFNNWAKVLAGPDHIQVMWRPGGGYYRDNNTSELIEKSHQIGRQVSLLPEDVVSIQSEIECFPYQRLKKAASIITLEACSHIASGCTGAAFNVLTMYDEPLDEFEPLIAQLYKARPFFDLLSASLGRSGNIGIGLVWNINSFAGNTLTKGDWPGSRVSLAGEELFNLGLPVSYTDSTTQVYLLCRDNLVVLSKEQIGKILSKAVYMDCATLNLLNEMGFGELTGFKAVNPERTDRIEKFSNHPLNGSFAGRLRDNRQSFWSSEAYTLVKTSDKAQVLSGLTDYTGKETSSCTMGIFENKLAGRICVSGYYPWTFMDNFSKSSQMKTVFRWLSKENLPGYVDSFNKANLWIRKSPEGGMVLALTNASFDPAVDLVLMIHTENEKAKLYDMECRETILVSSGTNGPFRKFVIPQVESWQMRLIVCDEQ